MVYITNLDRQSAQLFQYLSQMKVSPKKTPVKATPKKEVTPHSSSTRTGPSPRSAPKRALLVKKETTPAKKTGRTPSKRNITLKKIPVKVEKNVSSPRNIKVVPVTKAKPKVVPPAPKELPSIRKRAAAATSPSPKKSPTKKSKPDVKPAVRNLAKDLGQPLQSPPRPTRIISPPARLLDAAPTPEKRSPSAGQKRGSPVKGKPQTSPMLKSPPKPTRVVAKTATRPSRADMTTRRDTAVKTPEQSKVGSPGTKRAASAPAAVTSLKATGQKASQVKQHVAKSAERQVARSTGRQGTRSSERSLAKGSPNKTAQVSQKKETAKPSRSPVKVVSPKRENLKAAVKVTPSKGKAVQSPTRTPETSKKTSVEEGKRETKAVSHPCIYCKLSFRSRSDAELHEHRCNKNPGRSDKRYPCKQCNGMFTMSDLILHKKQAHPQREPNSSDSPPQSPDKNSEKAKVGTSTTEKSSSSKSGGIVVKVPSGGDLSDVIRQAIQAATTAGLVPANKRVVISGPNVKSSGVADNQQKRKAVGQGSSPTLPKKTYGRVAVVSPAIQRNVGGKKVIHLSSKSMLSKDAADSPPKFFTCLDCGDIFQSRKEVSEHKEECPGVGKTSVQSCMDCNQTFATRNELNAHKRATHIRPEKAKAGKESGMTVRGYKCSKCGLFFPVDSEVKKHISEFHAGEKASSIMCNVVATPDALPSGDFRSKISQEMVEEVIQNIVNGVRKGKDADDTQDNTNQAAAASTSSNTSTPETTPLPSPSSRNPGQCLDCFMKVSSRLELAKHKRSCEKALQNRQLFCFDCGKPFRSYIELNRHKQEAHGKEERMLKCMNCNLFFKSNPEWQSHQKTCHQKVSLGKKTSADWSTPAPMTPQQVKIAAANKALAQAPFKPASPAQQKRATRGSKTSAQKQKVSPKGRQKSGGEIEEIQEIKTTRSGRIVRKRRHDDEEVEEMIERGTGGKGKVVRFIDRPQAIGTIEFMQQEDSSDLKEEPSEDEMEEISLEPIQRAKRARTQKAPSSTATAVPENQSGKDDERTSISLANGLVTISADKANDYQIFVDAKKDGSSIQVKLVRNEESAKSKSPSTSNAEPEKTTPTRQSPTRRGAARAAQKKVQAQKEVAVQKEIAKPAPTRSGKAQAKAPASTVAVQANRKGSQSASTAKSQPATAEDASKDTGKVVQKGKPFVIGGQTLVPIQLPPGFELPGGSTGGQKVFAIPSTNLPPGLLQLLAKQNKASAPLPPPAKPIAPQPQAVSKKTVSRSSPTKSPKAGTSASQDLPPSLKGMTGAQLMARAQAKILGRPLSQGKVAAPTAPAVASTPQAKSVSPPAQNPSPQAEKQVAAAEARASTYNDPLFVYQCTSCNANFKSTFDVKTHMRNCVGGLSPRSKRQRLAVQKKEQQKQSTDVWHIKPVATTAAKDATSSGEEDVEWFVASSKA